MRMRSTATYARCFTKYHATCARIVASRRRASPRDTTPCDKRCRARLRHLPYLRPIPRRNAAPPPTSPPPLTHFTLPNAACRARAYVSPRLPRVFGSRVAPSARVRYGTPPTCLTRVYMRPPHDAAPCRNAARSHLQQPHTNLRHTRHKSKSARARATPQMRHAASSTATTRHLQISCHYLSQMYNIKFRNHTHQRLRNGQTATNANGCNGAQMTAIRRRQMHGWRRRRRATARQYGDGNDGGACTTAAHGGVMRGDGGRRQTATAAAGGWRRRRRAR